MKQFIRSNTFETNSSSVHSLSIVNKDDFEKFKAGELYYYRYGEFIKREDILYLEEFKAENYNSEEDIDNFLYYFCDGDYSYLYTSDGLDYCAETVYDKEGNEKIAFSVYISD